jgi:hypothetical protein
MEEKRKRRRECREPKENKVNKSKPPVLPMIDACEYLKFEEIANVVGRPSSTWSKKDKKGVVLRTANRTAIMMGGVNNVEARSTVSSIMDNIGELAKADTHFAEAMDPIYLSIQVPDSFLIIFLTFCFLLCQKYSLVLEFQMPLSMQPSTQLMFYKVGRQ